MPADFCFHSLDRLVSILWFSVFGNLHSEVCFYRITYCWILFLTQSHYWRVSISFYWWVEPFCLLIPVILFVVPLVYWIIVDSFLSLLVFGISWFSVLNKMNSFPKLLCAGIYEIDFSCVLVCVCNFLICVFFLTIFCCILVYAYQEMSLFLCQF